MKICKNRNTLTLTSKSPGVMIGVNGENITFVWEEKELEDIILFLQSTLKDIQVKKRELRKKKAIEILSRKRNNTI